ncbi:unnamed protein product [Prorocentrum cordatum]|uniref:Nuclear pore complex protein n=1 Tax=Prorocentrum cordatum TaxID=2364126 RepID=A0ABN9SVR8_9DINO|nr:unnamed protein product [Polarella glacialis]
MSTPARLWYPLGSGNLQIILSDNPKTKDIFARSRGFPRAEIMQYAAECKACGSPSLRVKACVAMAVVAADINQRWSQECSPEDRNFLGEAIEKAGNVTWPDFGVAMARGLWDRIAAKFIIIDHLVRYGSASDGQHKLATEYVRATAYEVLCSQFKAPWLGNGKEASFLHLHPAFKDNMSVQQTDEFTRTLVLSHTDPGSQLPASIRAFVDDASLSARSRADAFVSFLSQVRGMGPVVTVERPMEPGAKKSKTAKPEMVDLKPPETVNLELFLLDSVIRDFVNSRVAVKAEEGGRPAGSPSSSDDGANAEALADLSLLFEAVLLLSTGESLSMWGKLKLEKDTKIAKDAKRFLSMVGCAHVAKLLTSAAGGKRAFKYSEDEVGPLIAGAKLWAHDNRRAGYFSEQSSEKRAATDYCQTLRNYIKLDVCLEGDSMWKFFQALEEESGYMASCFSRLAPKGSSLRKAISEDISP